MSLINYINHYYDKLNADNSKKTKRRESSGGEVWKKNEGNII